MDAGTWRGVFTAIMLLLFVGLVIWAWSSKRKKDFEAAAQLPLEEDSDGPPVGRSAGVDQE